MAKPKHKKICIGCETEFIPNSGNQVICDKCKHRECEYCGKIFVPKYRGKKVLDARFCSYDCMGKSYRNRIIHECPICGKLFETRASMQKRTCSRECQGKWIALLSRLRPKKRVRCECLNCGRTFYVYPSTIKKGGLFCSLSCHSSYKMKKLWEKEEYRNKFLERLRSVAKPNKAEKKLMKIMNENHLPFEYVGDGSVMIDGLNPDFINHSGDKIVELFGRYWHTGDKKRKYGGEKERREFFRQKGYDLLVIWEDEISNQELVIEKVNRFLGLNK